MVRVEVKHLHMIIEQAEIPAWLNRLCNLGFIASASFGLYCFTQLTLSAVSRNVELKWFVGFATSLSFFWVIVECKSWLFYKILYEIFCAEKPSLNAMEFFLDNHLYRGSGSQHALKQYLERTEDKELM
ncbi:hypothetical protein BCT07_13995 [Vibrio breoganii]|nr:hypothetical protein BCT07_13995 [Vibrio breoganii]